MASSDAVDVPYTIKFDVKAICNKIVQLHMLTDNMSLFYILTKARMTTENLLMIWFKDSYKNIEIDDIAYVKSEYNITNPLTKIRNDSIFLLVLRTSKLDHPIGQWIIRGKKLDDSKKG